MDALLTWQVISTIVGSVLAILSLMAIFLRSLNAASDARIADIKDSFADINAQSDTRFAELNAASDARIADIKDSIATQNDKIHDDIQSLKTDVKALTTEMSTHRENDIKLTKDVEYLKTDVSELKTDMAEVKVDIGEIKQTLARIDERLAKAS